MFLKFGISHTVDIQCLYSSFESPANEQLETTWHRVDIICILLGISVRGNNSTYSEGEKSSVCCVQTMLITDKHCVNKPDYNCLSAAYCSISSTCLPRAVCAPLWTFLLTGNHFMVDQSRCDMTHSLNRVEEEVKVQLWNVSCNRAWHTGGLAVPPGRHHEGTGSVSYLDLLLLTKFFCKLMLWWWSQTRRDTRNQMITKGQSPKFSKTNWTERTCKNMIGQNVSITCNFLKKYTCK